jgi:hypothetical protein
MLKRNSEILNCKSLSLLIKKRLLTRLWSSGARNFIPDQALPFSDREGKASRVGGSPLFGLTNIFLEGKASRATSPLGFVNDIRASSCMGVETFLFPWSKPTSSIIAYTICDVADHKLLDM